MTFYPADSYMDKIVKSTVRTLQRQRDKEILRWHGVLGHTYVVLTDKGALLETCSREAAIECARGEVENPRVYNQYKPGKWRKVPT